MADEGELCIELPQQLQAELARQQRVLDAKRDEAEVLRKMKLKEEKGEGWSEQGKPAQKPVAAVSAAANSSSSSSSNNNNNTFNNAKHTGTTSTTTTNSSNNNGNNGSSSSSNSNAVSLPQPHSGQQSGVQPPAPQHSSDAKADGPLGMGANAASAAVKTAPTTLSQAQGPDKGPDTVSKDTDKPARGTDSTAATVAAHPTFTVTITYRVQNPISGICFSDVR